MMRLSPVLPDSRRNCSDVGVLFVKPFNRDGFVCHIFSTDGIKIKSRIMIKKKRSPASILNLNLHLNLPIYKLNSGPR